MKKPILTLFAFICCLAVLANEPIEVVALMKAQYDRTLLGKQAGYYATRAERRTFVVNELKAFAEASQRDLRGTLDELEQEGLVSSIQSLWSANALYFTTTEEVMWTLAERPDIEWINPVKPYRLVPEKGTVTETPAPRDLAPHLSQVHANWVWKQGYYGQGVVVALIDSGVNYHHIDLIHHLWDGGEEFPNHGYDIINQDDDPMDDLGHGTHCAGIVCGDGSAGDQTGVAPKAVLMCVKTVDNNGYGGAANMVLGMEWAVEHGCDAISMSLGVAQAQVSDKQLLRRTCEAILDASVIAVVCTGNEGNQQHLFPIPNNVRVPASCPPPYLDLDQMENPGGLSCVLSVGAVDYSDVAAPFTSQGPVTWQDTEFGDYPYEPEIGLIRPDVCAPGVNIWSLNSAFTDSYTLMSGTSQATPCVAGIVALMLSKNPELTPAQICQILEETSLKLTPTQSNVTGVGRVDAFEAVKAVAEWDGIEETEQVVGDEMDGEDLSIQVIDLNGRLVYAGKDAKTSLLSLPLPAGLYLLRSIRNGQVKSQKIVIP